MYPTATRIADLWIGRYSAETPDRVAARSAVAHLKPAVLITGGSQGIGFALAYEFLSSGRVVVLVARDHVKLVSAVTSLGSIGRNKVFTIAYDVTMSDAYETIGAKLAEFGCYLDILINNTGTGLAGHFTEHTSEEIDALLTLNIIALTRLTRLALPDMIARGQGGIINAASLGAYVPGPNQAAYYASKSYVLSFTEAIAAEITGLGVRVCALAPGPVDTSFHAAMDAERAFYRILLPARSPAQIARSGYRGFTFGRRVIVSGIFNHLTFAALKLLPHLISVPIVKILLRKPKQNS